MPCWIRLPRVSPSLPPSGVGLYRRPPGRAAAQAAERAIGAEQAVAHLLELGIGRIGIVQHAGHVGIDPRLRPRGRRSRRGCRARPGRRRGPGLRWSSRAWARPGTPAPCAARSTVPAPVTRTSGPTRLRSLVAAWPLSMRNEAPSWLRSVACSLPSCHPDSVLDVSERIIWATLRPRIAPSCNTANTVPSRFDMMACGLAPAACSVSFACNLPSSLSKSAALCSSGSARTPARSLRSA